MSYTTSDDERFVVHNRKEIVQILSDLAQQQVMISASWNHGKDRALTSVIGADYDKGAVYLDISADDAINQGMLGSSKTIFSSAGGVKIQWSSPGISSVKLKDGNAFKIALPQDLIRVQRREFYRLSTPVGNPVRCIIPLADTAQATGIALLDISAGGLAGTVMDEPDAAFAVGAEFHHCKIDFPGIGTTDLTLRIKWMGEVAMKNSPARYKLAMEFINPSRGNQALIQRYIIKLERELLEVQAKTSLNMNELSLRNHPAASLQQTASL